MLFPNKTVLSLLLCVIITIVSLFAGCIKTTNHLNTTTAANYKTFVLKSNDIYLRDFDHPLYSFEYPPDFSLVDENLSDFPSTYYDQTRVLFTIQRSDTPKPQLSIIVQKPGKFGYHDAAEKFEYNRSRYLLPDNITTKRVNVFGISSYYLEVFSSHGSPEYHLYQSSQRSCFFDYAGLVWEVTLDWFYHGNEPLEVQEYFDHIITTFKILE
jgi:hypothetical protein